MNKTIGKVAVMTMAAAAMINTSCSTQKKAQNETATADNLVVSRPEPGQDFDDDYLILDDAQRDLVKKNNGFAIKLFTGTAGMGSTVVSPLSVTYLMGMLANGADGTTREEIMATIGAKGVNLDEMNALYRYIMSKESRLDKSTTINVANYMAVNKNISLKDAFTQTLKQQYMAGVESLDFSSSKSADRINGWCKKQTEGMIPSIIDNIDPSAMAYIMNAIYFNGTWQSKFDKSMTKDERFQGYTRNIQYVKMMHQNDDFLYADNDLFSAVRLPYGNGAYYMTVLLPHNGKSIDDMMKALTPEKLQEVQYGMEKCVVDLKMPRFTIEQEHGLNTVISKLGAPSVFDATKADFSNMADAQMFVSKMIQKAKIEVSEEGTKAAAVTSAMVAMTALNPNQPKHVEFHANRPFVYMITERHTGAIFFMGQFTGAE